MMSDCIRPGVDAEPWVIEGIKKLEAKLQAQGEPVAVVDANDDGYWADILPNRSVKVGQKLYAAPVQAQSEPVAFHKWLKKMEWSAWHYDRFGEGQSHCPDCGNQQEDGHTEGCELAALLNTHPAPVQAQSEPVQFLANGTRFKTTLLADGSVRITGLPYELAGRWVALIAAENDCHMKLAAPVQQDMRLKNLQDSHTALAEAIRSLKK